jgi:hypothetical protein
MRVNEYDPGRRFAFEHIAGPAKGSIITFSIETTEGKTRFTEACDPLKLSGFYKLVGPFLTRMVKRESEATVARVKHMLESEVQSQVICSIVNALDR